MGTRVAATPIIAEQYKRRFVLKFGLQPLISSSLWVLSDGWILSKVSGHPLFGRNSALVSLQHSAITRKDVVTQRSHGSMQLSRCQAAGRARACPCCWRAVESRAVWGVTRPGGWSAQPSVRGKRGYRKVKNFQGIRAEDWLVGAIPYYPQQHASASCITRREKSPTTFITSLKEGTWKGTSATGV